MTSLEYFLFSLVSNDLKIMQEDILNYLRTVRFNYASSYSSNIRTWSNERFAENRLVLIDWGKKNKNIFKSSTSSFGWLALDLV